MVGHRGWPARYPDNTLAGFLAASSIVDMVEMDVRRSSDGKLVLSHDPVLGGHVVHLTPWSVLAEVDLGGGHHPSLLDEVLAALVGLPAQLEVKNDSGEPGYEPDQRLALETAERSRDSDIVTSFNPATIEAVRRDFDSVQTGLAVQFPPSVEEVVDYCVRSGHRAIIPAAGPVAVGWVESAALAGIEVYPWTVNDVEVATELVEAGVSGIITDDPQAIANVVRGDE